MSKTRQKSRIFSLAAAFVAQSASAYSSQTSVNQQPPRENEQENKDDAFRLSFTLQTPRIYATRYLKESRVLQIRITPARSEEFSETEFYNGNFVHRVLVKELNQEVFLNLQLKNTDIEWLVTHQEKPWRIIVDLWKSNRPKQNQFAEWNWDGYLSSKELSQLDSEKSFSSSTSITQSKQISEKPNIDLPQENASPTSINESLTIQKSEEMGPLSRFLKIENIDNDKHLTISAAARAKNLFTAGKHAEALNEFRREATLHPREFRSNPENLWLAGESAVQSKRIEVAKDHFLTLTAIEPGSSYVSYAKLRLLDIEYAENFARIGTQSQDPQVQSIKDKLLSGYREIALNEGAASLPKALASLRVTEIANKKYKETDTPEESKKNSISPAIAKTAKELLPNFEQCLSESSLQNIFKQECAFEIFKDKMLTDDLVSAQKTLEEYKKKWPSDRRVKGYETNLGERILAFASSLKTPSELKNWNDFEKKSDSQWLKLTDGDAKILRSRALAWENEGNKDSALKHYQKAADAETDPKVKMALNAKVAHLAAKSNQQALSNQFLKKLQAMPERSSSGLGAEEFNFIKELALAPYNNSTALSLFLDDIFKGFHAENDIRTLVSLTDKLDGTREVDVLFEKLLGIPSRSAAEAELKEDAIMNYAETLRNQGRLVKSADMFLAVANLDNGKNRAEAAYKAGVVFFRAGLLEKATSSWNIAASDLENSKYSALATERLNRIR